jgi:SAM-dependent methyltransferase
MTSFDEMQSREIVKAAYHGMFGRDPDEGAYLYYTRAIKDGELAPSDLYAALSRADEFIQSICRNRDYKIVRNSNLDFNEVTQLNADTRYNRLDVDGFPVKKFADIFERVKSRSDNERFQEYCRLHEHRFRELFGIVGQLCSKRQRVLEVSTSPVSSELAETLDLHYVSADHPSLYPEYNGAENPVLKSKLHISVDMNYDDLCEKVSKIDDEKFDLVIYCEIIEHLMISPYDQIHKLKECLRPGGYLFISTPNFFSHERLKRMRERRHPLDLLPPGESFIDGAHHVREYTMSDLFEVVTKNGMDVFHYSWSKCWDMVPEIESWVDRYPQDRTNLYVIAQLPE